MLKTVACQGGVIGLDVDLDLALQTVAAQEPVDRSDVIVVLVLGRFSRLGFNQDRAFETDFVFVLHHHVQEAAHLIQLMADARVQQRLIAFATAPQHVVFTTQLERGIHRFFHLQCRQRKNFGIRIGGGARHEAAVAEQVGGAPQQLHAGGLLLQAQHIDHLVQMVHAVARGDTLRRDVAVMKAIIRRAEFLKELKRRIRLGFGCCHRVRHLVPGPLKRAVVAKRVKAIPAEAVPVAGGEAQLLLHRFTQHFAVFVVPLEGQWVFGGGAFVLNRADVVEIGCHDGSLKFGFFKLGRDFETARSGGPTGLALRGLA